MRIIQVVTGSEQFGGAESHVRDLTLGLRFRGHDCHVLVGPPEGLFVRQLRERGVPVEILPALRKTVNPVADVAALLQIMKAIRRLNPDLVAVHTAKAGFLGRVAAAILRIPCVFTPHCWSVVNRTTGKANLVYIVLEKIGGWLSAAVIGVCRDEREIARKYRLVDERKLFVVYNGIPDDAPAPKTSRSSVKIIMIGRFQGQKDHKTLLQALARVKKYQWLAQLVGTGPLLEPMRNMAVSLGLQERIEFLGERSDTASLLSQADVFVLSTWREAFPISILEAMRAELPVIAANVGGISEAVEEGTTGFLVPPGREDLLANALEELLRDHTVRRRLGCRGRGRFLSHFSHVSMVDQTLGVYRLILAQSPASST